RGDIEVFSNGRNGVFFYEDISMIVVHGRDDSSVLDEQRHDPPSRNPLWLDKFFASDSRVASGFSAGKRERQGMTRSPEAPEAALSPGNHRNSYLGRNAAPA